MQEKQKKNAVLFVLAGFAVILSFIFDNIIVQAISKTKNFILDDFFLGITFISSEVIIFFFLTSLFLWQEHKRKWIIPLWLTLFLSAAVGFILKIIIQRARPFQEGIVSVSASLISKSYGLWNFSFPSFQTMLVFSALPIISMEFPKIKWAWIIFAFLVAFSRVYFGLHFLSDVIAGGILGYAIGIIVIRMEEEYGLRKRIRRALKLEFS